MRPADRFYLIDRRRRRRGWWLVAVEILAVIAMFGGAAAVDHARGITVSQSLAAWGL